MPRQARKGHLSVHPALKAHASRAAGFPACRRCFCVCSAFLSYAPSSPSPAAAFGPAADSPHNLPADAVGPLQPFNVSRTDPAHPSSVAPPLRRPGGLRTTKNGFHLRGNRCKVTVQPGKGACRRRARRKPGKTSGTRESAEAVGTPPKPWKTGCGCAEPSALRAPSGAGSRAHWPKPGRRLKNRLGGCAEP